MRPNSNMWFFQVHKNRLQRDHYFLYDCDRWQRRKKSSTFSGRRSPLQNIQKIPPDLQWKWSALQSRHACLVEQAGRRSVFLPRVSSFWSLGERETPNAFCVARRGLEGGPRHRVSSEWELRATRRSRYNACMVHINSEELCLRLYL